MNDILSDLGAFAFASRLKRLSDRLKAQASQVYYDHGVEFNDSWFLVGYMLSKNDNMTVTEMAEALGISPPAISQISSDMAKHGIIEVNTDEEDRRRRNLSLTEDGKVKIETLQPLWDAITKATDEMIEDSGYDFLGAVGAFETHLEKKNLLERVENHLSRGEDR